MQRRTLNTMGADAEMTAELVVCTQQRYAPNPQCCANHGSVGLWQALQQLVVQHGCNIQVKTSGCLGMCATGANIKCSTTGQVWQRVKPAQLVQILEAVTDGNHK